MTKRVLIICYYFPPLGLAGVGRPLNLFKRLPAHGYDCHVLTVKPVTYHAYEPELLDGLDTGKIFRSGSRDPLRLMHLLGVRKPPGAARAAGSKMTERMFPDSKKGWIPYAVAKGRQLIKQNHYDLIVSTSPPVSAHVVAKQLCAESGTRWVADFRDVWTTRPIETTYADPAAASRARELLKEITTQASDVTAVDSSVARYVGATNVITNGFDPDIAKLWTAHGDRATFTIGLLGTFDDMIPVEPLCKLLAVLRQEHPDLFQRVRMLQVGRVDPTWLTRSLQRYDLAGICDPSGFHSRKRTVELCGETSAFYVGLSPELSESVTTARIYDLLASGRPIFAYAAPSAELARLAELAPGSVVFNNENIVRAADALVGLIQRQIDGDLLFHPVAEYARQYSWESVVSQFARLFDHML